MSKQEMIPDDFELDDARLEAENRMKNLMWTVSGNYRLDTKLDLENFAASKYVSMYDAVKQGAFARYFDKNELALYLIKKVYFGADEFQLMRLAQLCIDMAALPGMLRERPGVKEIREKAFDYLLEHRFHKLNHSLIGKLQIVLMKGVLYNRWDCEKRLREPVEQIRSLQNAKDTMMIIRQIDELYGKLVDPDFVRKHGGLEKILSVTFEELEEFGWQDLLDEDAREDLLEQYIRKTEQEMTQSDLTEQEKETEKKSENSGKRRIVVLDEEAVGKVYSYIEKTYGRSYLTETEQRQLEFRLCRGAHAGCRLYYTEGIIDHAVMNNAQYVNAKRHAANNYREYLNHQNLIKRSVETMTDSLKRSLLKRTETERLSSEYGTVIPNRLWKIGRAENPGKLFYRTTKENSTEFSVTILMDASGSQRDRQSQVALQAYMIAESLSNLNIPHRMMSFCTFWDYTVMQRFCDFDSPRSSNRKVLEFTTSSNNRDGLAIRAAGDDLIRRREENKILIILSDGRPNDVVVNRPGSQNRGLYSGEFAVRDTAFEVRKLRSQGVYVLGVFTGREKDLAAEKIIFGRDFAYIRDIRNFSKVVSRYMQKLLEQDTGEFA